MDTESFEVKLYNSSRGPASFANSSMTLNKTSFTTGKVSALALSYDPQTKLTVFMITFPHTIPSSSLINITLDKALSPNQACQATFV